MDPFRPTYAEIDLKKLQHNIKESRKLLSPMAKFMAIVKANAYGHGAIEVSKAAESANVDYFGVASLGEAIELRSASIKSPILILSEIPHACVEVLIHADITQTVYTFELAQLLSNIAKQEGKKAKIHVKIDTGMGRVGILPENAVSLIKKIVSLPNLFIEGIFTHFSRADDISSDFTMDQFNKFLAVVNAVKSEGIDIPISHAANSAAMLNFPKTHLDMVRVGICMYGLEPFEKKNIDIELKPVLTFRTKVLYIKEVPVGTPLGYGATFYTKSKTQIATLPVGYADGLSRSLSNKGSVIIRDKRFPIVGTVTMDMIMVDIGFDKIKIGDDVVIIGRQESEMISASEIARLDETINYEVLCSIGKRVPRIYLI
jgi:alanine racemase